MNQKRQPAGVPIGGQFDSNEHDEAANDLADAERERILTETNDRISRHTYGGVVGDVNKDTLSERYAHLLTESPYSGLAVAEDADVDSDDFAALQRDLDSLDDYPSLDDGEVSARENALVTEHLRDAFDRAGGKEANWDAAIAKYRDDFQSDQPAEVTTEKNVYFAAEDDWIESLDIEDETYVTEGGAGIDSLGVDYLDKNSEAVIGFFEDEYGADIEFSPGAWDKAVIRTSPLNEDGHDLLATDNYESIRSRGARNVVAEKLQAYIENVNAPRRRKQ